MNEFARQALELADAWVVEAIHEALAANTGKISSADGDSARAALVAHLEGAEQKPSDSLKDSLRLDWCERHAVGIENTGSGGWMVFGDSTGAGKTLRAAIDETAFPGDQP